MKYKKILTDFKKRADQVGCKMQYIQKFLLMSMSVSTGIIGICPAYCDVNGNTAMQKFLKTMFSMTVFAGIVMIAAGIASTIRTVISMVSGEQAQPGALGRGIGLIVGGVVLCALKAIVIAIIGQDPTIMTFY